jgi:hypothetical protein
MHCAVAQNSERQNAHQKPDQTDRLKTEKSIRKDHAASFFRHLCSAYQARQNGRHWRTKSALKRPSKRPFKADKASRTTPSHNQTLSDDHGK